MDPEPAGSAGGESPEAGSEGNAGGASGDQLVDKTTTAGAIEDLKRDLEAKISSTGAALDELEGTHEQDASRLTEVQHAIQEQAEVIGRLDSRLEEQAKAFDERARTLERLAGDVTDRIEELAKLQAKTAEELTSQLGTVRERGAESLDELEDRLQAELARRADRISEDFVAHTQDADSANAELRELVETRVGELELERKHDAQRSQAELTEQQRRIEELSKTLTSQLGIVRERAAERLDKLEDRLQAELARGAERISRDLVAHTQEVDSANAELRELVEARVGELERERERDAQRSQAELTKQQQRIEGLSEALERVTQDAAAGEAGRRAITAELSKVRSTAEKTVDALREELGSTVSQLGSQLDAIARRQAVAADDIRLDALFEANAEQARRVAERLEEINEVQARTADHHRSKLVDFERRLDAAMEMTASQPGAPEWESDAHQPDLTGGGLNDWSFEDFRELGLSATQAVRVLKTREVLGGFTRPDQLNDVPGLSHEQRASLTSMIDAETVESD